MSQRFFVRELTGEEQRALAGLIRSSRDARVVRRAQMIRLSAQGQTAGQIAVLWDLTSEGVRRILKRFNAQGMASLADRHRGGRPRQITDRYVALLKEAVQTSPRDLGYPFSCWTLERLREHLRQKTHVLVHPAYLSQVMAKNQIVYRRPKHSMVHLRDPQEYDEKKAFLEFVKRGRHIRMPPLTCSTSMSVKFTSTRP